MNIPTPGRNIGQANQMDLAVGVDYNDEHTTLPTAVDRAREFPLDEIARNRYNFRQEQAQPEKQGTAFFVTTVHTQTGTHTTFPASKGYEPIRWPE